MGTKEKLKMLLSDKKKRNFFIYGIGQAFNLLSPLLVAPLVVSVCSESGFGKVGLGFALALFLILIVDYAFDIKGTKQVAENRNSSQELEKILSFALITKMFLFLFALLIGLFLIYFLPFFSQEKTLYLLSLTIVFAQVFNPVWFLQGIENFKLITILNSVSKISYVVLVFLLIQNKADYIFVNLFLGSTALLTNILGLFVLKHNYQFKIKIPAFTEIKNTIQSDFSFCISQLFLSVRQLAPLVLTGFFLGYAVAGQYKIIEQIITLFRTYIQVFLKFFYPSLCYKFVSDKFEGIRFWKKYAKANLLLVSALLLVLFVFSTNVLRFFHLSENMLASVNTIFRCSLLVSFLMAISLPLEQLMFAFGKHKSYIKTTIIVTVINVVLIVFSIKYFKLYSVVVSLIISDILFIILYSIPTYFKIDRLKESE